MGKREIYYVGTFGAAIYTVELDAETESLRLLGQTAAPRCPDVFALDRDKRVLYVGNENAGGHGGVSAFDVRDPVAPRLINFVELPMSGPCYVERIRTKKRDFLVGASFFDGRVQAFPLREDSGIAGLCCDLPLQGSGPYRHPDYVSKQDQSRVHCVVPIPHTDFFACADLGGDTVTVYRMEDDGRIAEVGRKKLRAGSGPRHIACAASGRLLYLVDELDCCVSVLRFHADSARLDILQRISALPDDFTGLSWCSAIHLSPDERFLYVGNRGYDSIAVFPVANGGARLGAPSWFCDEVSEPREFAFAAGSRYLLICGMKTDCVTLNRRDLQSGSLGLVSKLSGIEKPACIIRGD